MKVLLLELFHLDLLLIVLVAAFDVIGGSIDCFQCTDIDNIENCHHITVCQKASEVCFTKATRSPGNMKYSLGCEEQTHCGKNLIGRAIDANGTSTNTTGTLVCEECCTVPGCNKALCSVAQTSSSKDCNKTCSDSPSFDCATIDATFGICHDIHHAKKACRNFCGLCCLVDGAWSNWSSWSSCSVTCGNGTETRLRSCDNPPPVNGGLACAGLDTETKQCARDVCPINGQWSAWGQWTACSASCGYGVIKRHRNCDNPPPSGYGNHCFGDGVDFSICSKTQCGVNGGWTAWSSWSTCSATCERGMSTRSRNCSNPIPSKGGRQCIGNNQGYMLCDTNKACPLSGLLFTQWSPWTNCSENLQYRNRKCFLYGAVISLANCTSGKTVDFKSCDTSAG